MRNASVCGAAAGCQHQHNIFATVLLFRYGYEIIRIRCFNLAAENDYVSFICLYRLRTLTVATALWCHRHSFLSAPPEVGRDLLPTFLGRFLGFSMRRSQQCAG